MMISDKNSRGVKNNLVFLSLKMQSTSKKHIAIKYLCFICNHFIKFAEIMAIQTNLLPSLILRKVKKIY